MPNYYIVYYQCFVEKKGVYILGHLSESVHPGWMNMFYGGGRKSEFILWPGGVFPSVVFWERFASPSFLIGGREWSIGPEWM